MTNTIWTNPVSGDWTDAADWTNNRPNANKTAVINADGSYAVTISSADTAKALFMDAFGATLSEVSGGSLALTGGITLDAGTISLNGANTFGGPSRLVGGTLELGNAAALGTSDLTINGGTLIATATEVLSNTVVANGNFTLAAADGDRVKLTGNTVIDTSGGGNINFGQSGGSGVFIWSPVTLGVANSGTGFDVNVEAGTLRDGNGSLTKLLSVSALTTVAAGAKFDINGHAETIRSLNGGGLVNSTKSGGALTVGGGDFNGVINGALGLTVAGDFTLGQVNTFTGGTTVNSGVMFTLDAAGALASGVTLENNSEFEFSSNGSITGNIAIGSGAKLDWLGDGLINGPIVDNGVLLIQRPNLDTTTLPVQGGISGTGSLVIADGFVNLQGSNSFSGGTLLSNATLILPHAAALGTGGLTFEGTSVLLTTTTETIANPLSIQTGFTEALFLAAHGTTLTLNAGAAYDFSQTNEIIFGSSVSTGVIIWDTPSGSIDAGTQLIINGATLRAGDSNFATFLQDATSTRINAGTLDLNGVGGTITDLTGSGTLENTGAAATVTINGGNFSGTIAGNLTVDVNGLLILQGNAANWSEFTLLDSSQIRFGSPASAEANLSGSNDIVWIADGTTFTGSIAGFAPTDEIVLLRISSGTLSYSGDSSGGTLTITNASQGFTAHIALVGNYTADEFSLREDGSELVITVSSPSAPAAADTFDFSAAPATHMAPEAGVTHTHSLHSANEIALMHDAADAMHSHVFAFDHHMQTLFAHGHSIPEALV